MILINTTINQNYLQFNNQCYKQVGRLAMITWTSAILAEIFNQHLKHTSIINILKKHDFTDYEYFTYIDGLFIIYNKDTTNIKNTLAHFNSIHPTIQITIEKEKKIKLPRLMHYKFSQHTDIQHI
jgi:hypothetical protein